MKHVYIFLASAVLACGTLYADSPRFITSAMRSRNGLTDEQYEFLWSIGKRPSIDTATARDWMFRAARYHNVTNWLGMIGRTNDFAKAVQTLGDHVHSLTVTNKAIVALNTRLEKTFVAMDKKFKAIDKALRQSDADRQAQSERANELFNELVAERTKSNQITEQLNSAEARAARLDALKAWLEKQHDKAVLSSTKAIFQTIIDRIEGKENE